jgi:hypothetical protein
MDAVGCPSCSARCMLVRCRLPSVSIASKNAPMSSSLRSSRSAEFVRSRARAAESSARERVLHCMPSALASVKMCAFMCAFTRAFMRAFTCAFMRAFTCAFMCARATGRNVGVQCVWVVAAWGVCVCAGRLGCEHRGVPRSVPVERLEVPSDVHPPTHGRAPLEEPVVHAPEVVVRDR